MTFFSTFGLPLVFATLNWMAIGTDGSESGSSSPGPPIIPTCVNNFPASCTSNSPSSCTCPTGTTLSALTTCECQAGQCYDSSTGNCACTLYASLAADECPCQTNVAPGAVTCSSISKGQCVNSACSCPAGTQSSSEACECDKPLFYYDYTEDAEGCYCKYLANDDGSGNCACAPGAYQSGDDCLAYVYATCTQAPTSSAWSCTCPFNWVPKDNNHCGCPDGAWYNYYDGHTCMCSTDSNGNDVEC